MHQDATVTVTPIAACTAPTDSATTAAAAAAAVAVASHKYNRTCDNNKSGNQYNLSLFFASSLIWASTSYSQ